MPAQILGDINPDCYFGGYVVHINTEDSTAPMTLVRRDLTTGGLSSVRGMVGVGENVDIKLIDFEAPFDHDITYRLYEGLAAPWDTPIGDELSPIFHFRTICGSETMYIRWLFDPTNLTSTFCLGPIGDVSYQPRAGIFPVIGRADPVVVNDEQETARGTLRFIGRDRAEVDSLRSVLSRSAQPSLLTLPEDYMIGKYGQLYFQPLSVKEEWINPDQRIGQHALVVDYIEIAPPSLTTTIPQTGTTYGAGGWIVWATDPPDGTPHGNVADKYASFEELLASGKTFYVALWEHDEA